MKSKYLTGPIPAKRKTKKPEKTLITREIVFAVERKDGHRIWKYLQFFSALLTTLESSA